MNRNSSVRRPRPPRRARRDRRPGPHRGRHACVTGGIYRSLPDTRPESISGRPRESCLVHGHGRTNRPLRALYCPGPWWCTRGSRQERRNDRSAYLTVDTARETIVTTTASRPTTLLLIEDADAAAEHVDAVLREAAPADFEVARATSLAEAISYLQTRSADCAIVDVDIADAGETRARRAVRDPLPRCAPRRDHGSDRRRDRARDRARGGDRRVVEARARRQHARFVDSPRDPPETLRAVAGRSAEHRPDRKLGRRARERRGELVARAVPLARIRRRPDARLPADHRPHPPRRSRDDDRGGHRNGRVDESVHRRTSRVAPRRLRVLDAVPGPGRARRRRRARTSARHRPGHLRRTRPRSLRSCTRSCTIRSPVFRTGASSSTASSRP